MAKFCSNCGTGLDEAAKFCANCGTTTVAVPPAPEPEPQPAPTQPSPLPFPVEQQPQYIAQQQPAQQQAAPLPYAQPQQPYPQAPQPYPAAPPPAQKKSKKGLVIALAIIAVIVIGGIAAAVIGIAGAFSKPSKIDYYEMGNDKIPSVKLVLGEVRKVVSSSASISNGVTTKVYQYNAPAVDQGLEMSQYLTYLREEDGFLLLTDVDFNVPEASCIVGRNSVDSGYELQLQIAYNTGGYIITILKQEGEITPASDGEPDDLDDYDPNDYPEDLLSDADEWIGLWRGEFEDEDGEYVELFFLNEDGEFTVSIYFRDAGEDDYDLFGSYRVEDGKLTLSEVESDQGDLYNDMDFDCEFDSDTMTLDGGTGYRRVLDKDRPGVLADPLKAYP